MKRRLLSLLLALVMVFGLCSTAFAVEGTGNFKQVNTWTDGKFTDVPKQEWYAPTVQRAYELGLMKGNSDTTFSPSGNVTIAETLTLACRLHSTYYGNEAQFVQGNPWYQVYVDYAVANGIIAADDYTDYTAKATRAQFVTILAASMPVETFPQLNSDFTIPDLWGDESYASDVYKFYRAGVLTGSDSYGTFKPDSNITRSEVATIVVRLTDPSQRKSFTLEGFEDFTIDDVQGVWRSVPGEIDIEVIFNGNHFTYAGKYEYSDSTDYNFFQGLTGENMKQNIIYFDYLDYEYYFSNQVESGSISVLYFGNVVWVYSGARYFCLYKSLTEELTTEVRTAIGEENILPVESLKSSAVTSIRMHAPNEIVDASRGEGYYWPNATNCYATINGKEYLMDVGMLNWSSNNPSVASVGTGSWTGSIAVQANGTIKLTAEYNGMVASTNIVITNCVPVKHISDCRVLDRDGYYAFIYSLKDADNNRIARDCQVTLRIVNDNGETVYQTASPKYVWSTAGYNGYFGEWFRNDEPVLHGSLYIYDEEISPGTISTGKLYYRVTDFYGGVFFKTTEYSVSISDLPLKETSLELPKLPQSVTCYSSNQTIRHSCTVTDASYKMDGNRMTVYLSGQKTYDKEGSGRSSSCLISWKLYDSEGYVVDSGTCYTSSVSEGEKFRNAEINIYNLDIGGSYRLVLTNTN